MPPPPAPIGTTPRRPAAPRPGGAPGASAPEATSTAAPAAPTAAPAAGSNAGSIFTKLIDHVPAIPDFVRHHLDRHAPSSTGSDHESASEAMDRVFDRVNELAGSTGELHDALTDLRKVVVDALRASAESEQRQAKALEDLEARLRRDLAVPAATPSTPTATPPVTLVGIDRALDADSVLNDVAAELTGVSADRFTEQLFVSLYGTFYSRYELGKVSDAGQRDRAQGIICRELVRVMVINAVDARKSTTQTVDEGIALANRLIVSLGRTNQLTEQEIREAVQTGLS